MNKKVYFAGSIRGGRADAKLYEEIIRYIQKTDVVLTEHVGNLDLSLLEQGRSKDRQIYEQDTAWLRQSDLLIGECTCPSLGVGYELAYAEKYKKPCYLFYRKSQAQLSAMITGNPYYQIYPYETKEEIFMELDQILNAEKRQTIEARFVFRDIRQDEAAQAVSIEQTCFPPNEACSEKSMRERIGKAPELFLVAVDKETGKLAGFLNGLSTNETAFRDAFFTDADLYDPYGKNVMLLGLDVLPEYRMQGLGRELVSQYQKREWEKGRQMLILTCLEPKVEMYRKFGFTDQGIANSDWGGEEWHEMRCLIKKEEVKICRKTVNMK